MKCHGGTAYNNHMPWMPNGALPAGETVREEKNKSWPAVGKQNRIRLRTLGEGGISTRLLWLVMLPRPLHFSLLDLTLYCVHQVGALSEKQDWTLSGHCKFADQGGNKIK